MKTDTKQHLQPLIIIFIIISIFWIFHKTPFYQFIFLFLGLGLGAFFLDIDHIVYWLYTSPNTEESKLAKLAINKYDWRSVIKLIESTQKKHTNLIFHHFFFQTILVLISFFVFTSSDNVFGMSFLFSCHIHLLVHQYQDYRTDKLFLQDWLFAREVKQLPVSYLDKYLTVFTIFSAIFGILLLNSVL